MKKLSPLFIFLLFIAGCNRHFVATGYGFEEKQLKGANDRDMKLVAMIQPYKDSLDKEMNVVIAVSDTILTKSMPESDLGNLMCDLILKKSEDYSGLKVDFTFLNYGGIRLPNLPKGNITLGNVIELMPFENLIDVMKINGRTVDTLFNYIASKGGWPVSGARYKIKNGKAVDVFIKGEPLDVNKDYMMAVSDYLAQGGDNCTMLVQVPRTIYKKSLRDALIDGMMEMNAKGEHIKSVLDGRVQKID
jgi:2',3'-cyclic-nucleotide 2'-phosphodiesterase (5'-nucleotidase family)